MVIYLNGEEKYLGGENVSLVELLKLAGVNSPETVSVQVNGEFVEKEDYEKTHLKDGDEVDFLYFMGGGKLRERI